MVKAFLKKIISFNLLYKLNGVCSFYDVNWSVTTHTH